MKTSRAETPFQWYVTCGVPAYAALAGVRFDRIFLDAEAIVEGCPRHRLREFAGA